MRGALLLLLGLLAVATPPARAAVDGCDGPRKAPISIVGHGAGELLAARLAADANGLYEEVSAVTGARDCAPIHVDVTADLAAASSVLPAWHLPPWAAGAARPEDRHILLTVQSDGQRHAHRRVLKHELVHLSMASASGGQRVPRWFDEGVARFVAGEHGADDARVLAEARVAGRRFDLDGLAVSFPADQRSAALAYALSGRAISKLEDVAGRDAVARVLAAVRNGQPFDRALKTEAGLLPWQLSLEVKRSVNPLYAWMTVLSQLDLGLGFAGVLSLLAWWRVRRRRQARMAELEEAERPPLPGLVWIRWSQPGTRTARFRHAFIDLR